MNQNNQTQIVVSICCITYNHAPFIRRALDGFLMQEPPTGVATDEPWYEILIHDDASTDGTAEIIKEYASKYPDKIFPIYEMENQYTKVGSANIDMYNYSRVRGSYVAYCEGDDYWTDPLKLQKQVDYMEAHPEYSACFHTFRNYNYQKNTFADATPPTQLLKCRNAKEGIDIDLKTYFSGWYTQPMTMLFRVSMYDFSIRNNFKHFRDMHEIYFLMKAGKCRLMNFDGGVRNVHEGGIASMITYETYVNNSLPMDGEFYKMTHDPYAKKQYIETLDECVRFYAKTNRCKAFKLAIERFVLSGHVGGLLRHLKVIMKG